jgi:hypothetical protein
MCMSIAHAEEANHTRAGFSGPQRAETEGIYCTYGHTQDKDTHTYTDSDAASQSALATQRAAGLPRVLSAASSTSRHGRRGCGLVQLQNLAGSSGSGIGGVRQSAGEGSKRRITREADRMTERPCRAAWALASRHVSACQSRTLAIQAAVRRTWPASRVQGRCPGQAVDGMWAQRSAHPQHQHVHHEVQLEVLVVPLLAPLVLLALLLLQLLLEPLVALRGSDQAVRRRRVTTRTPPLLQSQACWQTRRTVTTRSGMKAIGAILTCSCAVRSSFLCCMLRSSKPSPPRSGGGPPPALPCGAGLPPRERPWPMLPRMERHREGDWSAPVGGGGGGWLPGGMLCECAGPGLPVACAGLYVAEPCPPCGMGICERCCWWNSCGDGGMASPPPETLGLLLKRRLRKPPSRPPRPWPGLTGPPGCG